MWLFGEITNRRTINCTHVAAHSEKTNKAGNSSAIIYDNFCGWIKYKKKFNGLFL